MNLRLALLLAVLGALPAGRAAAPNIVFILADDLGTGDLGCYGGKVIPTPNLDRMAAEGLRFTQAYSGSTVCAPSRCALMTGKHTGHGIVRANTFTQPEGQMPLPAGTFTLGAMLKQAGYATGAFGKWSLGGPGSSGEPARQGIDTFFGYLCQNLAHNYYPTMLRRNAEVAPLNGKTYSHTVIFDEALKFIREQRPRPFFAYVPVTLPHGELQVPDASAFSGKPWPRPVQNYAAMVALLDRDVGRLLALLKELSLDENTLVFFTSDNGAEVYYFKKGHAGTDLVPDYIRLLNSHGALRGYKRDLYEGGIRAPFIARWPGKVKPGVSDHVCAFWDLLPTLAELTAQKAPADTDGISFLPTLIDAGKQRAHPHLYWEFHEGGFAQAVRHGDWKAIRRGPMEAIELYDLKTDVGETKDVSVTHPEETQRAAALMQYERTDNPAYPVKQTATPGSGYAKLP
ncbi:MAG: arylsulfatase [Opitutaceae bacterium]|nr:arylsulfatase [Opitutaceae bacterium]